MLCVLAGLKSLWCWRAVQPFFSFPDWGFTSNSCPCIKALRGEAWRTPPIQSGSWISVWCSGPVCFPCLSFLSQSSRALLASGQVSSRPYWCQVEAVVSQKLKSSVRWLLPFLYLSWCCRGLLSTELRACLAQALSTSFELSQRPLKGRGGLCAGPCTTVRECELSALVVCGKVPEHFNECLLFRNNENKSLA